MNTVPTHRASGRARILATRTAGTPNRAGKVLTGAGLALAAVASTAALSLGTAQPAQAYPAHWTSEQRAQYERDVDARNYQILKVAQSLKGVPYRYGGTSPSSGFDCSGFTSYVYAKAGVDLPRTSSAQANAVQRISASTLKAGDLVFFHSGGSVYHVGIYAGNGHVWHAPNSGSTVEYAKIWTSSVFYGRA